MLWFHLLPRLIFMSTWLFVCAAGLTARAEEDPLEARLVYFEKQVRPLLVQHCYECHSQQSEDVGGGLLLDRKTGWMQGGDSGPAIIPGDPDRSLILKAVRYADEGLQMPPDGRMDDSDIAILVRWITDGAEDPRTAEPGVQQQPEWDLDKGREFWAFQPPDPSAVRIPRVIDKDWPRHELDLFILRQLEERGLRPVPQADKRTLIRRATFDLTGLPPTPAEVEAFVRDQSPNAYSRLVDRLLASQHYGERWGRFWLDVARYADSNGLDENIAHGNAWRYRDYVIQSLNDDKPYDRFVLEQLAGDLLPDTADEAVRHQRAIATGFLSLGPKVLAEVDETKMEMDIIDEQVETVGRAFLGLTLGCARCHDHKFDPIRTEDYYALAGIFKSTKTMEHFTKIARWNEVSIATPSQENERQVAEQQVAEVKQQIDTLTKAATQQLRDRLGAGATFPDDPERHYDTETRQRLQDLKQQLKQFEASVPTLPTAMGVVDYDSPTDLCIHIRGSHLNLGAPVARGFPAVLASDTAGSFEIDDASSGRLQLARWLVDRRNPLVSRVIVNRVWRWHFGRGLVESTDNLGHLGKRPINGPLLDWLALRFMDDGWSLKSLHRRIMLSSAYQMSSDYDAANAAIDQQNRWQWRANVRRLEAETIRDAMLQVSGLLDKAMGGSLLHVNNREFLFDHTSKDTTNYGSLRRAVYLPVIRNHLYDMFQLFDYADASVANSDRASTVVAPQALFMMNSDLVHEAAGALAERVLNETAQDMEGRLEFAYQLVFGREPTAKELQRDKSFLTTLTQQVIPPTRDAPQTVALTSEQTAWRLLCQTLLASNEFIYVN